LGRDVCQAQRILLTTRAQPSSTILQKGSVSWNSYGVMTQRKQCDKLNPTHRERLDSIGFVWQPKRGPCVASKISVTVLHCFFFVVRQHWPHRSVLSKLWGSVWSHTYLYMWVPDEMSFLDPSKLCQQYSSSLANISSHYWSKAPKRIQWMQD
jgi:hypothetical protein